MQEKKKLLQNTFIIALGRCSTQVLSFLLLPLYTSLLSTSEYGNYDLLNTISIFIIPFITLLMEESMFRFLIDAKDEKEKAKVISQSMLFTFFNIIMSSIIILIIGSIIHYDYTIYLIFFIIASILSTLAASIARGEGKFKIYSVFSFLSGALTILFNILFIVVFKMKEEGLFIAYILGNTLVSLWLMHKLKVNKYVNFKNYDKKQMKEMLSYSIPLVPNSLSWITINLSDRLIIVSVLGSAYNGIYSVATKFPSIINTFYSFFYIAWKESASKAVKEDNKNEFYNDIYINLKKFLIAASIMILAALPFVFNLLVNKNYQGGYIYIPILIVAILYSNLSSFCGGIFAAYKETKIMGTSTFYAAVINIVVNIALIKFMGLWASAISTLASSFIVYIYRRIKMKKFLTLQKDKYIFYNILMFIFITLVYYSNNIFVYLFGFIICLIYSILLNIDMIKAILSKLKTRN